MTKPGLAAVPAPQLLFLAMAFAGAGCSCSCGSHGAANSDAGAPPDAMANEGSAPDAPADVSIDASVDAAPDTAADVVPDGSAGMNVAPEWTTLSGKVAGCEIQRLTNPQQLRVFEWEPCPGIAGCERTVTNQHVLSDTNGAAYAMGAVADDTGVTRMGFATSDPSKAAMEVYYTTEDGQALDGYRPIGQDPCAAGTTIHGTRGAIDVGAYPQGKPAGPFGGILSSLTGSTAPVLFDLPQGQVGSPSGINNPLGDTRWLWTWSEPDRLTSVIAADGTDFRESVRVEPNGPLVMVEYPVTTGSLFLFHEYMVDADAGTATAIIASSDGSSAPTPYLVPTDDSFFLDPGYAGTHVAWVRGLHPTNVNTFASGEMWASPYSPNPAQLKPYKVDDLPFGFASSVFVSAHGKYAAVYWADQSTWTAQVFIWDLTLKTRQTISMGPNLAVKTAYGLTQNYVYVGSAPPNTSANKWVMRLRMN